MPPVPLCPPLAVAPPSAVAPPEADPPAPVLPPEPMLPPLAVVPPLPVLPPLALPPEPVVPPLPGLPPEPVLPPDEVPPEPVFPPDDELVPPEPVAPPEPSFPLPLDEQPSCVVPMTATAKRVETRTVDIRVARSVGCERMSGSIAADNVSGNQTHFPKVTIAARTRPQSQAISDRLPTSVGRPSVASGVPR